MESEDAQSDSARPSRAWLGLALVVFLLVAAGALFLVWRPETYTQTVAALTEKSEDANEPMSRAGATPVAKAATPSAAEGTLVPRARASQPSPTPAATKRNADDARVERVAEQQGGLEQRLNAAEQRLARLDLQAQAAAGNAARAEGLLIAFATRRSIERGAELGYLADQLRLRFGDALPNAVRTLVGMSREPVTIDQLLARLEGLEPSLRASPEQPGLERLRRELSNLFIIRRQTAPSPQPQRRLDRARMFLETGRYEAAIEEVQNMPGASSADGWIADVRRYAAAQRALDLIETAAVLEPRRLRDGQGERIEQPSPVVSPSPAE
ncbi:MICOS complex subunit MIC60 [Alteriqipengyuania lutimaris]|uniref:Inner membrane protein n=1 Tax=Alteriqipengyuania lutimaris TaxID=1538146 RepID=A0A395LNP1_9SPHN|nr:hypothetical protein [Alteriqipengyuania lutimaris]MBB3033916.1 hypothetical protein [Alteriqipengyuania lutimaris]RDS77124.1 hypothetical protein DL238_05515 [Alteriqipengyuania lutimaris]